MRTSRSRIRASASSQGIRGPPKAKQSSVSCAMSDRVLRSADGSQADCLDQEVDDGFDVVQVEDRARSLRKVIRLRDRTVAADGKDLRIFGCQQRLFHGPPPDFELQVAFPLEALDDHEVDRRKLGQQCLDARFRLLPKLVHQGPAVAGGDEHFRGTCLAMLVGVLSWRIHVEVMVRVLYRGYREPAPPEGRDQLAHQRRLSRAAPACQTNYLHRAHPATNNCTP